MANGWIESLKHNAGNLVRFSGRDRARLFWPYAGTVIVLIFIAWGVAFSLVLGSVYQAALQNPGSATIASGPGQYSVRFDGNPPPEIEGIFQHLLLVMSVLVLAAIILLAAAVVRRLHDRNRNGIWGLLPVPFLTFGLVGMAFFRSSMNDASEPPMGLFMAIFVNNIIYLACLITLIVMLAGGSDPDENRFGPLPTQR